MPREAAPVWPATTAATATAAALCVVMWFVIRSKKSVVE
jgi:hypothetical protein